MNHRQITAVHILPVRTSQGYHEYLVHPHERWAMPSLPAKKLPTDFFGPIEPELLRSIFDVVWHEEMGLDLAPAWIRCLAPVSTRLLSPTAGEITEYRIVPILAPVARKEHRAAQSRLVGSWQRRSDLLTLADLSPTARLALEQLHQTASPSSPPPQDANWTQRLLWGIENHDSEEIGRLLLAMTPWLRSQLHRCPQTRCLLDNEADVEDVLSESRVNVLLHLDGFIQTASAGAWIWTITFNTAISSLRRRARRAAVSLDGTRDGEPLPVPAREGDVLEHLEQGEEQTTGSRLIREVLATSHPDHRRAFELRYRDELQFNEIAAVMGENQNTVAGWIQRIKRRLEERGRQEGQIR